jgi:SAM-dependent methyltransferase
MGRGILSVDPDDHDESQAAATSERMRPHRGAHAQRTAQSHAAHLLPHLRPGMRLIDLGCGPGSITVGLAAAVTPGLTVGVDVDAVPVDGVAVVVGDVRRLPFPDASFDAIFASAVLQHVAEPADVLREARRVARTGAVIALVDADWDGELLHPTNAVLRRSREVAERLRSHSSPFVGKQLRQLLDDAGFVRAEASASVLNHGTADETRAVGQFTADLFRHPASVERAVREGIATRDELEEMARAWTEWGEQRGAFLARFWCEAVAWAP